MIVIMTATVLLYHFRLGLQKLHVLDLLHVFTGQNAPLESDDQCMYILIQISTKNIQKLQIIKEGNTKAVKPNEPPREVQRCHINSYSCSTAARHLVLQ
jgi:hypothetical protein